MACRFDTPFNLLLNQRDAALDKVCQVLALEHAVREQGEVDDLADLAVLLANLLKAGVALGAEFNNALR